MRGKNLVVPLAPIEGEVDPATLSDDLLSRIHDAETEASDALAQEEYTADGLFGPDTP